MVTEVPVIRNTGATIDRMVEVQPAGQSYVQGMGQLAKKAEDIGVGIYDRVRENSYNNFQVSLSENLDRIEKDHQSNPDGFNVAADGFYKSFAKKVSDPVIRQALDKQYTSWKSSTGRRVSAQFEQNLNQDAQYSSLKVLDNLENEMSSIATDFFSKDPNVNGAAAGRFANILERYQGVVTQRKTDGSFLFSPEFAVNKESQIIDRTIANSLVTYLKTDKDPMATLTAIKEGKDIGTGPVMGVTNPLEMLSPGGKERAIALAEAAVQERSKAVLDGWNEVKAATELQMAIDPLKVDLDRVSQDFLTQNEALMTPETSSKIRVELMGLAEKYAKETKDYRNAYPYLSGTAKYDGSDNAKKGIETAYEVLQKRGDSLLDRAKWLQGTGYNDVPANFVGELEATFQAAIVNQDRAKLELAAGAYDIIEKMGPAAYAHMGSKLGDTMEGAIMMARDVFKVEGVGPEQFKAISEIMKTDKATIDQRRADLKKFQSDKSFAKRASEILDTWVPFDQPSEKNAVVAQMGSDFQKIYQTKFLATGDEKTALKATEAVLKNPKLYGRTDFNRSGFMRMPPEAHYMVPNDNDTEWMRQDLVAAMTHKGLISAGFDEDRVQLLSDPNVDWSAKEPEYQIAYSNETATSFDTTGQVWKPDTKARALFIAQRDSGRLDKKYFTEEIYNPVTKKTYTRNLNAPSYRQWIADYYSNGGQSVSKTSEKGVNDVFEKGIIHQESRGNQFGKDGQPLTSPKGAIGISQVMPKTAPEAAKLAGVSFDDYRYRTDAEYNKTLGRAYFQKQYDDFGNMEMAIMAYNAGPGAVEKHIKRVGDPRTGQVDINAFINSFPYSETRKYVRGVTERVAYAD